MSDLFDQRATKLAKEVEKNLRMANNERGNTRKKGEELILEKKVNGEPLTEEEQALWEQINFIVDTRLKGLARHRIATLFEEKFDKTKSYFYQTYNRATNIFFQQYGLNRDAERAFLAEQFYDLAAKAKVDKNYELAEKCYSSAAKVMQLDREGGGAPAPALPVIVFTSQPASLKKPTYDISGDSN